VTDTPKTQESPDQQPAPVSAQPAAPETAPVDPNALPDLADSVVGQVHSTGDNQRFVVVQTTEGEKAWEPVPVEPEVEQPAATESEAPPAV
jgi:hypothetical protein